MSATEAIETCAVTLRVGAHLDTVVRKTTPLPPEVRERMQAAVADRALPRAA